MSSPASDGSSEQSTEQSTAQSNVRLADAKALLNHMQPSEVAAALAEAEGWNPEDGDELSGVVVAIKAGQSEYKQKAGRNPNYPIVFIMDDAGTVTAIHCFQTVLENEMRQQRPLPGEFLYVKRIGEATKAKPGQSPTIRYAVYVERGGSNNDPWSHMD